MLRGIKLCQHPSLRRKRAKCALRICKLMRCESRKSAPIGLGVSPDFVQAPHDFAQAKAALPCSNRSIVAGSDRC